MTFHHPKILKIGLCHDPDEPSGANQLHKYFLRCTKAIKKFVELGELSREVSHVSIRLFLSSISSTQGQGPPSQVNFHQLQGILLELLSACPSEFPRNKVQVITNLLYKLSRTFPVSLRG